MVVQDNETNVFGFNKFSLYPEQNLQLWSSHITYLVSKDFL